MNMFLLFGFELCRVIIGVVGDPIRISVAVVVRNVSFESRRFIFGSEFFTFSRYRAYFSAQKHVWRNSLVSSWHAFNFFFASLFTTIPTQNITKRVNTEQYGAHIKTAQKSLKTMFDIKTGRCLFQAARYFRRLFLKYSEKSNCKRKVLKSVRL